MATVTAIYFLLLSEIVFAEEPMTAQEIIQIMTETMNPRETKARAKMTIVTTSGQERTFLYDTYSKDSGEKSLMKYLEPKRVKGQAILMLNDANDIWIYFPRTKRIRKLATHAKKQKLEGSDFSYEDLGSSNEFVDEYDSVRLEDERKRDKDCYTLELTRKRESSAGYSRVVMWVEKETFVPLVIDYYHDTDPELHEKELVLDDIQLVDSIYTPMRLVMYNKLDNTRTKMEFVEIDFDVELSDDLFTEMGMQR